MCRYDADDLEDIHCHLTNTARAAEDINFDEAKFVRVRYVAHFARCVVQLGAADDCVPHR